MLSIFRSDLVASNILTILFLAGLALPASAQYDPGEFQEDTTKPHAPDLVWPEKEFPDPKENAKGFKTGERFHFRAQWGIFRKAGQLTISTEETEIDSESGKVLVKMDTRSAGVIRALYPMTLIGQTVLDTENGRILSNHVTGNTRSDFTDVETTFDYQSGQMRLVDKERPDRNKVVALPYPVPLDYSSAILQIRGWDLAPDSQHSLFVSSRGKFYLVEIRTMAIEALSTKFGSIQSFRLEPVSAYPQSKIFREGGKMTLWVSADERRIPLRIDVETSVGTASMRLDEYSLSDGLMVASAQGSSN